MTGTSLAVVGGDERRARVVWSHLVEPVVDPSRSTPGLTVTGLIARDGALRPLEGLASGSLTLAGAQARLAGLDLAAHLRALDRLGIIRAAELQHRHVVAQRGEAVAMAQKRVEDSGELEPESDWQRLLQVRPFL